MGCTTSLSFVPKSVKSGKKKRPRVFVDRFREPDIVISDKEKAIIKRQWKVLSANTNEYGVAVFLKIFLNHPEIKELFPYKDMEKDKLLLNSAFKHHASRFMHAVGAAVTNIDDLETAMSSTFLNLGKQHFYCTGFKPIYFEIFYHAIVKVWKDALGVCYTNDCADAWSHVLVFMMEKLKKGYHLASIEQVTRKE